ncbi:MAG: ABC transporter ATP-binding protein, partial [Candidatus Riflebacteria bacterium]|nr:ABC transporter ATP-binding protein [Candidatus Riflebacteria bacterium]
LDAGQVVSFLTALVGLFTPIRDLSRMSNSISMAIGAGERVFEILDAEIDIKEKEEPIILESCSGAVDFKNVSFCYDVKRIDKGIVREQLDVLKNIDFSIKPGEIIALVGPSGSGKSTFVNLIPRFFDVKGGSIEIDGKDVRDLSFSSMRKHIAMVPQDTLLFSGTIEENIRLGRLNATNEEIKEAAKLANAHNFILNQPNGYDTVLGERGVNLSGGQAQRIALARAFLKDPAILILDEATSALDSETENLIKESLNLLMKNRTTFMIAHRLSTVVNADKILVLSDCKIAEVGKHQELLDKQGLYAQLYRSQYGEQPE